MREGRGRCPAHGSAQAQSSTGRTSNHTPLGYRSVVDDVTPEPAPSPRHARGSATRSELTRTSITATLHCLTGCAIGEVLGMVATTGLGWGNTANIVVSIALAFFFGYALTMRPVLGAGLAFGTAVKVALAADTVSILTMELVDNGVLVAVPGAIDAGVGDVLFWASLAISLVVAFVLTVPVNRAMIGRGRGHAVVHEFHHSG
jgi:hypothetical protein